MADGRALRMHRSLYRPSVVLLDEATSALDLPNEARCYSLLQRLGVSYLSTGHRTSLRELHAHTGRLTPQGIVDVRPTGGASDDLDAGLHAGRAPSLRGSDPGEGSFGSSFSLNDSTVDSQSTQYSDPSRPQRSAWKSLRCVAMRSVRSLSRRLLESDLFYLPRLLHLISPRTPHA